MTKIGRYVERALDRLTVTTMLLCSDSVLGFLEGRPASAGLPFCFVADFVEVVFWGCSGAVCPNVCLMLQCASDGCHSVASGCRAPAWNSFQSMPVPCLLGGRTSRTRPADYSPVRHPQPAGAMPVGDAERLAHGLWAKMTTKPLLWYVRRHGGRRTLVLVRPTVHRPRNASITSAHHPDARAVTPHTGTLALVWRYSSMMTIPIPT